MLKVLEYVLHSITYLLTRQNIWVAIFSKVAFYVGLNIVRLTDCGRHLVKNLKDGKLLSICIIVNVIVSPHIELFVVASFSISIFGFVELVDDDPQVGSSDLCISTQDQLIQGIMDEVVLGL